MSKGINLGNIMPYLPGILLVGIALLLGYGSMMGLFCLHKAEISNANDQSYFIFDGCYVKVNGQWVEK